MIRVISCVTLATLFGYLSGYHLSFSSSLIKISILIFIISILFLFKSKKEIILKTFIHIFLASTVFFIYGNIVVHNIKLQEKYDNKNISGEYKIKDIKVKDNTKIIKLDTEYGDVVTYNFNNRHINNLYVDDYVNVEGEIVNKLIIMPNDHDREFQSFDLGKYWRTRGVKYIAMNAKISTSSKTDNGHSLNYYSYSIRKWFVENINYATPGEESSVISAMVWGDEDKLSRELNNIYRDAGASHILVLSGYNLAILIACILFLFKNNSRVTRVVLSFIFVFVFMFIVNAEAPLVRACIMSLYSLLSLIFLKPNNARFSIWLAGFVFVLFMPVVAMNDVSFHLSFLATLSIVYFFPESKIFIENIFPKLRERFILIKDLLLLSLAANILVAPYLIFQFGYFKISSIILNVFISLFTPIITILGVVVSFVGKIFIIGKVLGSTNFVLVNNVTGLVKIFSVSDPLIKHPISFMSLLIIYFIIFFFYEALRFFNLKYPYRPITK